MQKSNNEGQTLFQKRRCIYYKPNGFFQPYEQSVNFIFNNFHEQTQNILVQSLSILVDKIRKVNKNNNFGFKSPLSKENQKNLLNNKYFTFKKEIKVHNKNKNQEEEFLNTEKQVKQIVQFQKTGKKCHSSKQKELIMMPKKDWKNQILKTKKHDKLIKSLNKLAISPEKEQIFSFQNQNLKIPKNQFQNDDLTNQQKIDSYLIKNKSISQLQQAKAKLNKKNIQKQQEQESQYQITDHQSNQSSNNDSDYQEKICYQKEQTPIFGTLFGGFDKALMTGKNLLNKTINQKTNSKLNPFKFNFKQIMNSPKKSKSKKKRLYIHKKKVPIWAQNLQKVQEVFHQQQNIRNQFNNIFGICYAQDIQTDTIFKRNDQYTRHSTAKWQRKQNGFMF